MFDKNIRVFTKNGWNTLDKITKDTLIASSKQDGISFLKIKSIIKSTYDGKNGETIRREYEPDE